MAIFSDLNYMDKSKGSTLYDLDSLVQAVFTLLSTRKRTKPFKPTIGSNLDRYLFEPCDEDTAYDILMDIIETFKQDPRLKLNLAKTQVIPNPAKSEFILSLGVIFPSLGETTYSIGMVLKQAMEK